MSDLLKSAALNALPSIVTTKSLGAVSHEDTDAAETLVEEMVARASDVSGRLRNKQEAAAGNSMRASLHGTVNTTAMLTSTIVQCAVPT